MLQSQAINESLNQLPKKIDYAYKLGKVSHGVGKSKDFNPYTKGGVEMAHLAEAWNYGWKDAAEQESEELSEEMTELR